MECSKLFSGDLPEMTIHIIKYLENDMPSLHSCILVNRFWCRIAIPILWKDPFYMISHKKEFHHHLHFLDIYFLLLNDDDKKKLKIYKVGQRMNSFSFEPLFNYPSFIKTLNTYQLEFHVANWLNLIQKPHPKPNFRNHDFYGESLPVLKFKKSALSKRYYKMAKTFCTLLFKLFINNNASLNNLSINIPPDSNDNFFVEIYDSILKKPNFISNIENFILKSISPNLQPFLSSLPSLLSSIKNLNFYLSVDTLLTKNLENIIQSQGHLSSLTFSITPSDIINTNYLFYAFKYCSKTLTSIRFSGCNFRNNSLPFKPLKYLTQLKSLHFINCLNLNIHILQPLLDISTPLKIKSLSLHCSYTEGALVQQLIQKIGAYLENLSIDVYSLSTETMDCIINNCENIKFLHLYNSGYNRSSAVQLITHFKDNIEYLTIEYYGLYHNTTILKELGQNLPVNLKYLNLNISPLKNGELKIFLENCKSIKLKKLLIQNGRYDNLQILKTFVQEKNLEYLAYYVPAKSDRSNELLKEIQSFVKISRYENLVINITDFDEMNEN